MHSLPLPKIASVDCTQLLIDHGKYNVANDCKRLNLWKCIKTSLKVYVLIILQQQHLINISSLTQNVLSFLRNN